MSIAAQGLIESMQAIQFTTRAVDAHALRRAVCDALSLYDFETPERCCIAVVFLDFPGAAAVPG